MEGHSLDVAVVDGDVTIFAIRVIVAVVLIVV